MTCIELYPKRRKGMDKSKDYHGLRFTRPARVLNPRLIIVGLGVALFCLVWLVIPLNFLFFLLILPVAGVVWVASYGWRAALSTLQGWLRRLERFLEEVTHDSK
jgi:hypothetical protein